MINFLLGMLAMYFLTNAIIIIVLYIKEIPNAEKPYNYKDVALRTILFLILALPFLIIEDYKNY